MIKDLENIKGDLANTKTIPIIYGETASKKVISLLTILTIRVYFLVDMMLEQWKSTLCLSYYTVVFSCYTYVEWNAKDNIYCLMF
jgi:4-hydroxybenzoate polyprenyltransferase